MYLCKCNWKHPKRMYLLTADSVHLLDLGVTFIGELGAAAASDACTGQLLSGGTPMRVTAVTTQCLIDTHSSILQAALVRLIGPHGELQQDYASFHATRAVHDLSIALFVVLS